VSQEIKEAAVVERGKIAIRAMKEETLIVVFVELTQLRVVCIV
jgi:hypothetical protein